MTAIGHKRARHLIEGEAFRRIIAGEAPATLDAFARDHVLWLTAAHRNAAPMSEDAVARYIHDTWDKRHELIRGGDL
jgi:hypothetical protein